MFDVRRSMFALLVLGLCCTFGVAVRCDCLSVDHEQLSNPNGVPGQFSYSFNFVNNTNVPMAISTSSPVTNCLTGQPGHFKVLAAIDSRRYDEPFSRAHGKAKTAARISVSTFAAHTTNLTECCSAVHCVNAPSSAGHLNLDIALAGTNAVIWWPAQFNQPRAGMHSEPQSANHLVTRAGHFCGC
jgi:hypothetical protein